MLNALFSAIQPLLRYAYCGRKLSVLSQVRTITKLIELRNYRHTWTNIYFFSLQYPILDRVLAQSDNVYLAC